MDAFNEEKIEKTTIELSAGYKNILIITSALVIAFSIFFIILSNNVIVTVVSSAFLFFGLFLLIIFLSLYTITFDDSHIEYQSRFKSSKSIVWAEIQNIRVTGLGIVLNLLDGQGNTLMNFDMNMENSQKFINALAKKCSNVFQPVPNHTFRSGIYGLVFNVLISIFIGGLLFFLCLQELDIFLLIVGICMFGYALYTLLLSYFEVTLNSDRLTNKSLLRIQEILLSDIVDIQYEIDSIHKGNRFYSIMFTLSDGKQVPSASLGKKSLPAFLYIRSWWKQGRAQQRLEGQSR